MDHLETISTVVILMVCFELFRAFLDGFKAFYEDELGITVLLWRVLLLSCYREKNRYRETMR